MKQYKYIRICLLLVLVSSVVSSCKLGKHYTRPNLNLPERIDTTHADSSSVADIQWQQIYTDTILQALIHKTLEYNKDMLMATARVKELAALKRVSFANFFPEIGVDIYAERERIDDAGSKYSISDKFELKGSVRWELDLWGKLRWEKDKSTAEFMGAIESQRAMKMSLIAQVAQAYFELVALDNELAIVRKTVDARRESLHLAHIRFEGGLTSETAFRQAQVELARTSTLVPDLERKVSLKEHEIAFLTGEYPYRVKRSSMPLEISGPPTLPVGLPSSLLERRPDIRQAEQSLIAANAAAGVAYTNMFPRLALTVEAGAESKAIGDLLKSPYHLLAGNLLGPVFAMGKNRSIWKAKKAACEQTAYAYEKTVLNAFKEVRNAIVEYNKMQEVYDSRLKLEQSSRSAVELAQLQYINGVIGYMDLLDTQRGYLDAQIGLSNAIRDKQIAMVNLYKALGGGW